MFQGEEPQSSTANALIQMCASIRTQFECRDYMDSGGKRVNNAKGLLAEGARSKRVAFACSHRTIDLHRPARSGQQWISKSRSEPEVWFWERCRRQRRLRPILGDGGNLEVMTYTLLPINGASSDRPIACEKPTSHHESVKSRFDYFRAADQPTRICGFAENCLLCPFPLAFAMTKPHR